MSIVTVNSVPNDTNEDIFDEDVDDYIIRDEVVRLNTTAKSINPMIKWN